MSRVHSAIGSSSGVMGNVPNRFVVPNEAQKPDKSQMIDPSIVSQMRSKAQESQKESEGRALLEARHRVELITGLGRKTKNVDVSIEDKSITFTLRSLKAFEQNLLAEVMEEVRDSTAPNGAALFSRTGIFRIKTEALAHSLFLVDSQPIDVVLGTSGYEYDDQIQARRDLVQEMDGALVDYLFVKYEELNKETYDGYSPKTSEEVAEMVGSIRKSGQNA